MSIDEREEGYDVESLLHATIRDNVIRHAAPSVQIGSGKKRSGVPFKFHAVIHALRLLSPSIHALSQMIRCIFIFLGDQGTGSGFLHIKPYPLLGLDPPTQAVAPVEDDFAPAEMPHVEVDSCEEVEQDESTCMADVTGSLEVDNGLDV